MSINVILFALSFTIAALTGLCFWLFRRNRRLQSLLQIRHAFEEMLARREQEEAREQARPLPWEQTSEFAPLRFETVSLVDENPRDESPIQPEAPHLLLELEPVEGDSGPERHPRFGGRRQP